MTVGAGPPGRHVHPGLAPFDVPPQRWVDAVHAAAAAAADG